MAVNFRKSSAFEEIRSQIEQHLFYSVLEVEKEMDHALRSVERFSIAIDRLMETLEQMYQIPRPEDMEGEKSFPIRDGQFRVFFKISARPNDDFDITFIDIDHNKQSNLDRFPTHKLITFNYED